MPKKLIETLEKLADLLHWLGRYGESNEIGQLAQILSNGDFKTPKELAKKLLYIEELEQLLDKAANEDIEGCYKTIQHWHNNQSD